MLEMLTAQTSSPKEPQADKTSIFLNQRCRYPPFSMGNVTLVVYELLWRNEEQKFLLNTAKHTVFTFH